MDTGIGSAAAMNKGAAPALSQRRLIAVEGIDGSGKSTIVEHVRTTVKDYLESIQYPVSEVHAFDSWSANKWTKQLRELFVSGINDTRTEMLLAFAARRALVMEKLLPHMNSGIFCVVDRYFYSTIAYQCVSVRDMEMCLDLIRDYTERVIPGLTIYLNADYETALGRVQGRGKLDSIEQRGELFFEKLDIAFRVGFSVLAGASDTYSIEVDARDDLDTVKARVTNIVNKYMSSLFNLDQLEVSENKDWLRSHNITTVEHKQA